MTDFAKTVLPNKRLDEIVKCHVGDSIHLFNDCGEDFITESMDQMLTIYMTALADEIRAETSRATFDYLIKINDMSDEEKIKYINESKSNIMNIIEPSEAVYNYYRMKWEL